MMAYKYINCGYGPHLFFVFLFFVFHHVPFVLLVSTKVAWLSSFVSSFLFYLLRSPLHAHSNLMLWELGLGMSLRWPSFRTSWYRFYFSPTTPWVPDILRLTTLVWLSLIDLFLFFYCPSNPACMSSIPTSTVGVGTYRRGCWEVS